MEHHTKLFNQTVLDELNPTLSKEITTWDKECLHQNNVARLLGPTYYDTLTQAYLIWFHNQLSTPSAEEQAISERAKKRLLDHRTVLKAHFPNLNLVLPQLNWETIEKSVTDAPVDL